MSTVKFWAYAKFSRKKERRWFGAEKQQGDAREPRRIKRALSWFWAGVMQYILCALQYLGKYLNLQTLPFSEMYNVPMAQNVK